MRCWSSNRRWPGAALALAAGLAGAATPTGGAWLDPATAPAEILPLAAKSLMLDVVRSARHYVAVGARGEILLSDGGEQWLQVETPTRATLTAVAAVDAQVWAVGHDGVILHSADSGEHWQLQRSDPWQPADAGGDPTKGAPLLDVLFTDPRHGIAIGAYSLALQTSDGGEHWLRLQIAAAPAAEQAGDARQAHEKEVFTAEELKVGQEPTPHLNAIARTGSGALFIVAERGSAFRSRDGTSWQRLQLPYDGSMFGVLGYEGDHVLAFGLRGHAYESRDLGDHWQEVPTGTELSLMGGAALAGDGAVIVGVNGLVLMRANGGEPLHGHADQPAGTIATVLPLKGSATLLLLGENGITTFTPE